MSSYLNIYSRIHLVELNRDIDVCILSFSRNSDIYQAFDENYSLYSSDATKTEITSDMIDNILSSIQKELNETKDSYIIYLETNSQDIESISYKKEYMRELQTNIDKIEVISEMIQEVELYKNCEHKEPYITGIYAYID